MKIEKVSLLFHRRPARYTSYQRSSRVSDEGERDPRANVLPVVEVSETLFPFCIVTPWMPDGSVTRATQEGVGDFFFTPLP